MNEQDLQAFFDRLSSLVGQRDAIDIVTGIRMARCNGRMAQWDGDLLTLPEDDKRDTMGALRHLQVYMGASGNPEYATVATPQ